MTREIPLSKGYVALVDDADYARVVGAGKWSAQVTKGRVYAKRVFRVDGKPVTILLHRFLTGWPEKVDHINGDGLDNRRSNLRPATHAQNLANRGKPRHNTSGFKGVYATGRATGKPWFAAARLGGRQKHLGVFDDPAEAARAYDAAALKEWGEFARLNFPKEMSA